MRPILCAIAAALVVCCAPATAPPIVAVREPHRSLDPITVDPPERDELPAPMHVEEVATIDDAILHELRSAVVLSGAKSVGATSIVLRLSLDGGAFAAFKPDTKKHRDRWRAEVAAWRLAHALGLEGVPPSVPRAVKLPTLLASIASAGTRKKLLSQAIVHDEQVDGAMIAWLPHLRVLPLEREPMRTAWGEWLAQHVKSPAIEDRVSVEEARELDAARPLMAQISSMIVFDHLTGNRDRWSGANVMVDETATRLVFLDNNLAFDATIDVAQTKKRARILQRVERFSRALVDAVRAIDRASLVATLGVDDGGGPLLSNAQIDAVMARREQILSHVDRLISLHGEDRVLCFD